MWRVRRHSGGFCCRHDCNSYGELRERMGQDKNISLQFFRLQRTTHLFLQLVRQNKSHKSRKNLRLDFDDALTFQAMKVNRITDIISYDKDFDAIPGIKRLLPEDFL